MITDFLKNLFVISIYNYVSAIHNSTSILNTSVIKNKRVLY